MKNYKFIVCLALIGLDGFNRMDQAMDAQGQ
jgi:hypothetical protein